MVKKFFWCVLLGMLFGNLAAQVRQEVEVMEYQGAEPSTPLSGVLLSVANAPSIMSDDQGHIALQFRTYHLGDPVQIRNVELHGYEVFNTQATEQWTIASKPFRLLLCKSERIRALREHYMEVASENYKKQLQQEQQQLRRELAKQTMDSVEHQKRLSELEAEHERHMAQLSKYVEQFVRIDLSSLSAQQARLIELVNKGEFDKAIQLYEEADYPAQLQRENNEVARIEAAQQELGDVMEQHLQKRKKLLESIDRQVATYQLAGGRVNHAKAHNLLKAVADADTTNMDALHRYVSYCSQESFKEDLFNYGHIMMRHSDDMMRIQIYSLLATFCLVSYETERALGYIDQAVQLATANLALSASHSYQVSIAKLGAARISIAYQMQDTATVGNMLPQVLPALESLYADNPETYESRYSNVIFVKAWWKFVTGTPVEECYAMVEERIQHLQTLAQTNIQFRSTLSVAYNRQQYMAYAANDYPSLLRYSLLIYKMDKESYVSNPQAEAYGFLVSCIGLMEAYLRNAQLTDFPQVEKEAREVYEQVRGIYGDIPELIYLVGANSAEYYHMSGQSEKAHQCAVEALARFDEMDEDRKSQNGQKVELLKQLAGQNEKGVNGIGD